jgi:hypothetical protein
MRIILAAVIVVVSAKRGGRRVSTSTYYPSRSTVVPSTSPGTTLPSETGSSSTTTVDPTFTSTRDLTTTVAFSTPTVSTQEDRTSTREYGSTATVRIQEDETVHDLAEVAELELAVSDDSTYVHDRVHSLNEGRMISGGDLDAEVIGSRVGVVNLDLTDSEDDQENGWELV